MGDLAHFVATPLLAFQYNTIQVFHSVDAPMRMRESGDLFFLRFRIGGPACRVGEEARVAARSAVDEEIPKASLTTLIFDRKRVILWRWARSKRLRPLLNTLSM